MSRSMLREASQVGGCVCKYLRWHVHIFAVACASGFASGKWHVQIGVACANKEANSYLKLKS